MRAVKHLLTKSTEELTEWGTIRRQGFKKTLGGQVKKVGIGSFMLSILNKLFLIQFVEPAKY